MLGEKQFCKRGRNRAGDICAAAYGVLVGFDEMKQMNRAIFILLILASSLHGVIAGLFLSDATNGGQGKVADTNEAHIEGLLKEMHDAATWGLPGTNGIQLGVAIFNGSGVKPFRTFTYLYDDTNFWIGLYPPSGYRLTFSLLGPDGENVEKTREGNELSKPIGVFVQTDMRFRSRLDLLPQKNPIPFERPFNLLDCFKIEKPGTNVLTIGATVYKRINDVDIGEIQLCPVSIVVPIMQADLDGYRASK